MPGPRVALSSMTQGQFSLDSALNFDCVSVSWGLAEIPVTLPPHSSRWEHVRGQYTTSSRKWALRHLLFRDPGGSFLFILSHAHSGCSEEGPFKDQPSAGVLRLWYWRQVSAG